jgi:hypothetical protein
MTRINALRNILGSSDSVAWGKTTETPTVATAIWGDINALVFAAVLLVCSVTVGCSSAKPKPVSSNYQIPATQAPVPIAPAPMTGMLSAAKPAPKKVVRSKPATVNYADKTYGVTFEYPRRYAIETGNAAWDLLTSSPVSMNFIVPGGVALAAVELPETGFANTDFSSAFFDVSVNKGLTADQCNQFAVPQPKVVTAMTAKSEPASAPAEASAMQAAPTGTKPNAEVSEPAASSTEAQPAGPPTEAASSEPKADDKSAPVAKTQSETQPEASGSKLLLGDLELHATEAVSGEGTRQSDAKYFHVFQNGACYEFALNVTTVASQDGLIKHVDRDKVFGRLEKILDTVKINPIAAPEVTAEAPATPPATETPAQ